MDELSESCISTYPRKGTETLQQVQEFRIGPYISTYPRKGTETFAISRTPATTRFQLIPARGRKLESSHESIRMDKFQLIPARGRKPNTKDHILKIIVAFQLIPAKPSQALRASSPEGRAFPAATYLVLSSPFRGSWHGVSRD